MRDNNIVTTAKNWRDLLLKQGTTSHSFEMGSSSVLDLANTLSELLVHLDNKCNAYDALESRLAKLENGHKAQQEPIRAKQSPQPIKEAKEKNDAVA